MLNRTPNSVWFALFLYVVIGFGFVVYQSSNQGLKITKQTEQKSQHPIASTQQVRQNFREMHACLRSDRIFMIWILRRMNAPTINLQPLSIELGDQNSKPYKSIDRITWHDIPPFAVLTGVNGSGKTQLLQVLAYNLSTAKHHQYPQLASMPLAVAGDQIGPHEIAYLPNAENAFRIEPSSVSTLNQVKHNFLQRLAPQSATHNIEMQILRERIQRKFDIQIDSQQISTGDDFRETSR